MSRLGQDVEKENVDREEKISSLESQIKALLDRSCGSLSKLDGQIHKLDEHLSRSSASKRRKSRSPPIALFSADMARRNCSNPFDKILGYIAGSDSSRVDALTFAQPLTLDEITTVSPVHNRRLGLAACRDACRDPTHQLKSEKGMGQVGSTGPQLASLPGHRMPEISFHPPSALSSLSPFTEPRTQESPWPCEDHRNLFSPVLEENSRKGRQESTASVSKAGERRRGEVDEDDLRLLEERMEQRIEAKFRDMLPSMSERCVSRRDLELLQGQVTRLREEMLENKAECRALRVAIASEHLSVKGVLEKMEGIKQEQQKLETEQNMAYATSGKKYKTEVEALIHINNVLQVAVTALERQMADIAVVTAEHDSSFAEHDSSIAALRLLIDQVFEKCDALQKTTSRDFAGEDLCFVKSIIMARCEKVEHRTEALERIIASHCLESDASAVRASKDVCELCFKVDELAAQVTENKTQTLDMQSKLMYALHDVDDVENKWSNKKNFGLTNQERSYVSDSVKRLDETIAGLITRVESNENEIKCLDNNLLDMCSCIHALRAASSLTGSYPHPQCSTAQSLRTAHGAPSTESPIMTVQQASYSPKSADKATSCNIMYASSPEGMSTKEGTGLSANRAQGASHFFRQRPPALSDILSEAGGSELFAAKGREFKDGEVVREDEDVPPPRTSPLRQNDRQPQTLGSPESGGKREEEKKSKSNRERNVSVTRSLSPARLNSLPSSSVSIFNSPRGLGLPLTLQEDFVCQKMEESPERNKSREASSPSLRVVYSRRRSNSAGKAHKTDRSALDHTYTDSAPATPTTHVMGGEEEEDTPANDASICSSTCETTPPSARAMVSPSARAIVTSTRPAISHIIIPPTPHLVVFDDTSTVGCESEREREGEREIRTMIV